MVNIFNSLEGIPVYFIRWNPDNYKTCDRKIKKVELMDRYKLVGELIQHIRDGRYHVPLCMLGVIYLYYDGWEDISEERWEKIIE